jgi:hypothetical protein
MDAKKDVDLSSNAFVDIELPTCGIFSIDKLWNDFERGQEQWG